MNNKVGWLNDEVQGPQSLLCRFESYPGLFCPYSVVVTRLSRK